MKKIIQILLTSVFSLVLLLMYSCSDDESSPTVTPTTVNDIDGNVYHTVSIGNQVWMVENLKVKRYNNGDAITQVTDPIDWTSFFTGAWCNYNNDPSLDKDYGKHYNWHAVVDKRKLCPQGWHVPSDEEWTTLANSLGGESGAGGKLKESGTAHWWDPNTSATNESGFTGLPGGTVGYGAFSDLGSYGRWWSSTEFTISTQNAYFRWLSYENANINSSNTYKELGFCVRCLMD